MDASGCRDISCQDSDTVEAVGERYNAPPEKRSRRADTSGVYGNLPTHKTIGRLEADHAAIGCGQSHGPAGIRSECTILHDLSEAWQQ